MHTPEGRKGTHLFNLTCKPQTVEEWDLVGYAVGLRTPPHSAPILAGDVGIADMVRLKSCFAAMATTGGAAANVGINIVRVFHTQIGIADLALPYSKAVGNGFAKGHKLAPHRPFRQP